MLRRMLGWTSWSLWISACSGPPAGETTASDGTTTGANVTTEAVTTGMGTGPTGSGEPPVTSTSTSTSSTSIGETSTTTTGATTTTTTTADEPNETTGLACKQAVDETGGGPIAWARTFGWPGGLNLLARHLDVSPAGTIALADRYFGEPDFGGGPLLSDNDDDVYFALLDPDGGHLVSQQFKTLDGGEVKDIALAFDAEGNVFFAGSFSGTLELGGDPLVAEFGIDGVADIVWFTYDVFLAKFGPDGEHLWSRRFGDEYTQEGLDLAVTPAGRVVVAGTYKGTLDLGDEPLVAGEEFARGFFAEFTSDGELAWSRSYFAEYDVRPFAVVVDGEGQISSWGLAADGVDFGGGPLPLNAGNYTFVAQFDALGGHRWSRRFLPEHEIRSMVVDLEGAVILTGQYTSGDLKTDMFLARLAAEDGALAWNKQFIDLSHSFGRSLAVNSAGHIILAGESLGTIDLGGGPLGTEGGRLLAAYEPAGVLIWQRLIDGPGLDGQGTLACGPNNQLVYSATLSKCLDFGTGATDPIGHEDLLLLRIDP